MVGRWLNRQPENWDFPTVQAAGFKNSSRNRRLDVAERDERGLHEGYSSENHG